MPLGISEYIDATQATHGRHAGGYRAPSRHPENTAGRGQGIPGAHTPQANPSRSHPGRVAYPASVQSEAPGSVEANALI